MSELLRQARSDADAERRGMLDRLDGDAWDLELLSLSVSAEAIAEALAADDPARVDVALSLLRPTLDATEQSEVVKADKIPELSRALQKTAFPRTE